MAESAVLEPTKKDFAYDLFGQPLNNGSHNPRLVTEQDIQGMGDIPPLLSTWMDSRFGPRLDSVVEALIASDQASDVPSALSHLADQFEHIIQGVRNLEVPTAHHIRGEGNGHAWGRLRKATGKKGEMPIGRFYQLNGVHGHGMLLGYLTGISLDCNFSPSSSTQLPLFGENAQVQLPLFHEGIYSPQNYPPETALSGNHISEDYFEKLETVLDRINAEAPSEDDLIRRSFVLQPSLAELSYLMVPLVARRIANLRQHGSELNGTDHIIQLSLVGWARALVNAGHDHREYTFGREVWDLNRKSGLRGGRVDVLRFISGDGAMTSGQIAILEQLSARRFPSLPYILAALHGIDGGKHGLKGVFEDAKFWIGDGRLGGGMYNKAEELNLEPNPKDVKQVTLSAARLLAEYCAILNIDPRSILKDNPFQLARLSYIQPNKVITHDVTIRPEEQERYLQIIANHWGRAERVALMQGIDNAVVTHALDLVKNGSSKTFVFPTRKNDRQQPLFRHERDEGPPTVKVVRSFETYVDEDTRAIKIVGEDRNRKPIYELSIDRLMELGILPPDFNIDVRTSINCPFPDHRDRDHTPSFSLYPDGHFHCFGCDRTGWLSSDFNGDGALGGRKFEPHSSERTRQISQPHGLEDSLVIPEEHHRLISTTQSILQDILRSRVGMVGRNYLVQRAIDPDLAISLGAGFGSQQLITNLLETGYSLDELIKSGLIRVSTQVKKGLIPLLQRRGLELDEIKRPLGQDKETGETIYGWPYSALERRVTFPLGFPLGQSLQTGELEMKWTNIYGRAIWEGAGGSAHRKLSVANTRVPQGGFNMQVLGLDFPIIRITEGVFDAITLIQNGLSATMAFIGTANHRITRLLLESGKGAILTALDNDESGRKKAESLRQRLQELGFRGTLADFTSGLHQLVPETKSFKDPNDWHKNGGKDTNLRALLASSSDPELEILFYELVH